MTQPNATTTPAISTSRKNRTVRVTFENIAGEPIFHLPESLKDLHIFEEYGEAEDVEFVFRNRGGKPVYFFGDSRSDGVPQEIGDPLTRARARGGKSTRHEVLGTTPLQHGAADEMKKEIKIETHGIIRGHNVQKDDKSRVQKALHDDVTKVKVKREEKFEIKKSMQSESKLQCGSENEQCWENHASLTADVIPGKRKRGDQLPQHGAGLNSVKKRMRKISGSGDRDTAFEESSLFHEASVDCSAELADDGEGSESDGEVDLVHSPSKLHHDNAPTMTKKVNQNSHTMLKSSLGPQGYSPRHAYCGRGINRIDYEAWWVDPLELTSAEKDWLTKQVDLVRKRFRDGRIEKPVMWSQLGYRMFLESEELQRPDFRPLYHGVIGLAWDVKQWRFPGQDHFPIFFKGGLSWTDWKKTVNGRNKCPLILSCAYTTSEF